MKVSLVYSIPFQIHYSISTKKFEERKKIITLQLNKSYISLYYFMLCLTLILFCLIELHLLLLYVSKLKYFNRSRPVVLQ